MVYVSLCHQASVSATLAPLMWDKLGLICLLRDLGIKHIKFLIIVTQGFDCIIQLKILREFLKNFLLNSWASYQIRYRLSSLKEIQFIQESGFEIF